MKKKLVLVDTMAIIHRAYHAYPPLTTTDGQLVNSVYGFGVMFLQILKNLRPDYVIFASDLKDKTVRHEKYADYKANRAPLEEELISQFDLIYDFINATGLPLYTLSGYEADDIIGSIAYMEHESFDVQIVSGDKDMLQLLNGNITVVLPGKTFSDMRVYSPKEFEERFGFESKYYINYKALVGDTSDNIKGAKGIGEKTATELIKTYNTLGGIYNSIDKVKDRYRKILEEYKDTVLTNLELVEIHKNLKLDVDVEKADVKNLNLEKLLKFFKKYEFNSLINQLKKLNLGEIALPTEDKKKITFEDAKDDGLFDLNLPNFIFNDKFVYFDESFKYKFLDNFNGGTGFAIKELFKKNLVKREELGLIDDLQLMAYCMDPDLGVEDSKILYKKLFHKNIEDVYEIEGIDTGLGYNLIAFVESKNKVVNQITEKEFEVYKTIDLKLLPILAMIENKGMKLDLGYMKKLEKEFDQKISELKKKIFEVVGHEFNPNSTRELSRVLFDELQLPKMKKIKTGYSTNERTISKLIGTHPIIELILEYREYVKLQSTYVIGLQKVVQEDGRVHTELKQTVVATGRLSSINPNLQNIPTRSEVGEKIRKAFVPDEGMDLLSLDYSQIELRLIAHVSEDDALIQAFKDGKDIHTTTASLMFGIPESEVTGEQRRVAKMINFGIVYGISDFGLSDRLGNIDVKTAKLFIQKYFERYPKVEQYFKNIKDFVAKNGYVETLFGRKRYFNLDAGNYMMRQAMYREAINMPLQGSDSDIVKLSMISVQEIIDKKYKDKVQMLMQIHDELLFQVTSDKKIQKEFIFDAKEIMENVIELRVPLTVHYKVGKNWGEMVEEK